ncbi:MAG TPA: serine hydrolase domain-containing protein [Bacillota bacterium]|jgi:CubicO group peptidase (beta-lactamase class C family)|nr:serine hydrolase domain-containing protein [Bacillota bacterium]HNY67359.1 serine hydrolase domain-containing protein [Bacillota bacterium]HOI36356.1 serine hydrolase domain-containing protein [Bacillota bacterium]
MNGGERIIQMSNDLMYPNPEADTRAEAQGFDARRLRHAVDLVKAGCAGESDHPSYPGAVVLIMRHGVEVVHEAFGFRSYDESAEPMTRDTIFDVASLSKPIATATAVLRLVEMGEVNLDDPVGRYLPGAPEGITLMNLLTHTSGLPPSITVFRAAESRDDCVRAARAVLPQYAAGSKVEYSCMGFILLALLVEAVTGESLNVFARREIFASLGMKDTGYYTVERFAELARVAPTERRTSCEKGEELWAWLNRTGQFLDLHTDGQVAWGAVHDENALAMGGVSGNAGVFSTAVDIAKFGQMYLERGCYGGVRVLSPATVELATRNLTAGMGDNRGLGWQLKGPNTSFGSLISDRAYGHTGFTGTVLWIDPDRELVVVLLTNRVHETRDNQALVDLRPRFLNAVVAAIDR